MRNFSTSALALFFLLLNSCSAINATLKAPPIENSPFADQVLSEVGTGLAPAADELYPFHRAWRAQLDTLSPGDDSVFYVAPVDTAQIEAAQIEDSRIRSLGVPTDQYVAGLGQYLQQRVEKALRSRSFHVASERPAAGRIIELALVEASPTDVARNVIGTALGAVVPGGGIVSIRSSGSTAIEGVVRDAASGEVLFMFADRERGKTSPFSFNDFTFYSHARDAINDWAEQLAEVCFAPQGRRVADSSALTLLPL